MYRKYVWLTFCLVVVSLLMLTTGTAFAQDSTVPEGATVSPVKMIDMSDKSDEGEIKPQGTAYGSAGYTWINTSRISSLRAQAAFGAHSYVGKMQAVYWNVSWGDGKSNSGVNFPFSVSWSGQKLHIYSKSGVYTTALSGYAIAGGTRYLYFLNPVSMVYIN
jgi:hypothetical protein